MDEASLQKEMLIYLFSNYMANKPKDARKIPEYLSLEEFKATNTTISDSDANEYVKIYNDALADLKTKKLVDVLETINLQTPAKKTISSLIALDEDIAIDGLAGSSLDKLMQNPDANSEIREKKEEGLVGELFTNYMKIFGEEKTTKGKPVTNGDKKITENIKYIKIKEHDKLTHEDGKVAYLKKLGYAPINIVESRATKKVGRKSLGVKEEEEEEEEEEDSTLSPKFVPIAERDAEISGGSLLSTKTNQYTKVFQKVFLQKTVSKEVLEAQKLDKRFANFTNRKIQQLSKQKINFMEVFSSKLKNAKELTKPLKENRFEMVLSPEDIAFNNKHFYPPKYEQAEDYETYATPSDKDLYDKDKDKYEDKKTIAEGDVKEITKVPELDSRGKHKDINGKLQYHTKREGEKKKVGEKGEYIFPDFDDLTDLGKFEYDDGETFDFNLEFFQFERLKEIKETLDGADKRLEDYESEREEEEKRILDALKDLTKQAKVRIREAESGLEALNESMRDFVESKQLTVSEAKKVVQTGKLPKNYQGKSFIDPKDGKKKEWNIKNFSELFGMDGEGRPDSEKKEFPMPTKTESTPVGKIKNLISAEDAEDAYKNGLMDWIKRTFSKPLSDLSMLYEFEFQVTEKIIVEDDESKTTYSFSVALYNPTHEITARTVTVGLSTKGRMRANSAYNYKDYKYDSAAIRASKTFSDSVKRKLKKLNSSLL